MTRQAGRALVVLVAGGLAGCPPPRVPAVEPALLQGGVTRTLAAAHEAFARREPEEVRRAHQLYRAVAAAEPARVEARAGVVETAAWLVEAGAEGRGALVDEAVAAAEACPDTAIECQYWEAVALGLRARERPAQGLGDVKRIVELLTAVDRAAPGLEDAGPSRVLALLLVRAPGWPVGPGDPEAAVDHARKAVELAPTHPLNFVALGEALAATGDRDGAREAYRRAVELGLSQQDPDGSQWARQAQGALDRL